jgi:hypothetical protein
MAVTTFNAKASSDRIRKTGQATWALAHDATSGSIGGSFIQASHDSVYHVSRVFLLFDTSSLGASAIISAAKIIQPIAANYNDSDGQSVNVVNHTASDPPVADDFNNYETTIFSTVDVTNVSTSGTTDFALDANGIANINKTGVTKFAIMMSKDVSNTAPVGLSQYTLVVDSC